MAKGKSLHVGLNAVDPAHYAGWSGPLNACEADAGDTRLIAESRGFTASTLLTDEATRDVVIAASPLPPESSWRAHIPHDVVARRPGSRPERRRARRSR